MFTLPELMCTAEGRVKLIDRKGQKYYRAALRVCGRHRLSKRKFGKAHQAQSYGEVLAGRFAARYKQQMIDELNRRES